MIRVVCMYCPEVLSYKDGGDGDSHSLCERCYSVYTADLDQTVIQIRMRASVPACQRAAGL